MAPKRCFAVVAVLCFALPLFAKDKHVYQTAKLVSFKTVSTGVSCSASGKSHTEFSGNIDDNDAEAQRSSHGTEDCANATTVLYTVTSDGHTYVLRPLPRAFFRPSVLAGQLPGAKIEISMDKRVVHVRAGRKKSNFALTEAR